MLDRSTFFYGIDGATGERLPPPPLETALARALGTRIDVPEDPHRYGYLAARHGVDVCDLASAGWALVLPSSWYPTEILDALGPLIQQRKDQVTIAQRFRFQMGDGGWHGESKSRFLRRYGAAGEGAADPDCFPYYVLLVGGPDVIPYEFEHALGQQRAVGRIYFPRTEDYARYATGVVAAETGEWPTWRKAEMVGFGSSDDKAAYLAWRLLVESLADRLRERHPTWRINVSTGEAADKSRLLSILQDPQGPGLLFTTGHGMVFPTDDPRRAGHQGALHCGGHGDDREPPYLAADALNDVRVAGMIAFLFACHSAGTPSAHGAESLLAHLPRRLLAHPNGSALAVIGHVGRALGYSFLNFDGVPRTSAFEDTLGLLLQGFPVGAALEPLKQRALDLSTKLARRQMRHVQTRRQGDADSDRRLAQLQEAAEEAWRYVVCGDPAVRLLY